MTFEEYAVKNICEMKAKEPTAQNMRDVALLELWLNSKQQNIGSAQTVSNTEIVKETKDVLPAYFFYVESKRKYQLKEITKEKMLDSFKVLNEELLDLINLIYRNTDTTEERELLKQFPQKINIDN